LLKDKAPVPVPVPVPVALAMPCAQAEIGNNKKVKRRRKRIFDDSLTFLFFLQQVLNGMLTCREILRNAQIWIWANKKKSHPIRLHIAWLESG